MSETTEQTHDEDQASGPSQAIVPANDIRFAVQTVSKSLDEVLAGRAVKTSKASYTIEQLNGLQLVLLEQPTVKEGMYTWLVWQCYGQYPNPDGGAPALGEYELRTTSAIVKEKYADLLPEDYPIKVTANYHEGKGKFKGYSTLD